MPDLLGRSGGLVRKSSQVSESNNAAAPVEYGQLWILHRYNVAAPTTLLKCRADVRTASYGSDQVNHVTVARH
jgi:hypothetical protein